MAMSFKLFRKAASGTKSGKFIARTMVPGGGAMAMADKSKWKETPGSKAAELSRSVAALQAQRQRVESVRQQRIQVAQATAAAEAGGVAETSGFAGGVGAAETQFAAGMGANLGFQAAGLQLAQWGREEENRQAKQAESAATANIFGQVIGAGIGFAVGGPAGAATGAKIAGTVGSIFS